MKVATAQKRMRHLQLWSANFAVLSILSSIPALVIVNEVLRARADRGLLFTENIDKPTIYFVFQGINVASTLIAGGLGMLGQGMKLYKTRLSLIFALLSVGGYIAASGYDLETLFSTRFINPRGPMQAWLYLFVFASIADSYWPRIRKTIVITSLILSVYVAVLCATLTNLNRSFAMNSMTMAVDALFWPGLYTLFCAPRWLISEILSAAPLALYAVGSLLVQTRLNFVMLAGALVAYSTSLKKTGRITAKYLYGLLTVVVACIVIAAAAATSEAAGKLSDFTSAFQERMYDDTRSEQLVAFFKDVPVADLILGKGAEATWNWSGYEWKGATDVGYLSLLFYGGVPLLVSVWLFAIRPGFKAFRCSNKMEDLLYPSIVIIFSLKMFSSAFPAPSLEYYPILLASGRCWSSVLNSRARLRLRKHDRDPQTHLPIAQENPDMSHR